MKEKKLAGKILYGLLFLLIIPALQWWWVSLLAGVVRFPPLQSRTAGIIIGVAGLLLIGSGMFSLMKFGKGLPMNAYPPAYFVKNGPYRILRHPIYWGYGIFMAGVFIFTGSAAGLWIVTPVSILAMIALVLGYEKIDLEERFKDADMSVLLEIPSIANKPLTLAQRFASLFWVITFLLSTNFVIWFLTNDIETIWSYSPRFDVLNKFKNFDFIGLPFIFLVPLVVKSKSILRRWTISVLSGIALSTFIALLWPTVGAQYFYTDEQANKADLLFILLSTPIFLTGISAIVYEQQYKKWKLLVITISIVIILFQFSNSNSALLNLILSLFIFLATANYTSIWLFIRKSAETIANSWKEWMFGPIRIINRGFYVGLAAFGGILFCGLFVGRNYAWAILLFAIITTVCAALWAQVIEGSDKLKRPFGFYGAIVGIIFASIAMWLLGLHVWILIGIISVIMPWVQAVGRFGCLINGCCHGKPTDNENIGIRYYHYRSRVCNISGLKGKYLHPTQVYSILWLFFVGFFLLALWINNFPYSFIFGMYLILTGLGRFVEEAYRGEVQTPKWNGLRLYQWVAIVSVIVGIIFTTINIPSENIQPEYGWEVWAASFIGGFFIFLAMGVDFPRSNARFSRLV